MGDLKEFWGMMNVLDSADDVAVFVVSGRDQSILYCNHLVTVLTNAHTGSPVSQVWDMEDYRKANTRCNEGIYRRLLTLIVMVLESHSELDPAVDTEDNTDRSGNRDKNVLECGNGTRIAAAVEKQSR